MSIPNFLSIHTHRQIEAFSTGRQQRRNGRIRWFDKTRKNNHRFWHSSDDRPALTNIDAKTKSILPIPLIEATITTEGEGSRLAQSPLQERREEKQRDRVQEVIVQAMESKPIYRVQSGKGSSEGRSLPSSIWCRFRFEVESSLTVKSERGNEDAALRLHSQEANKQFMPLGYSLQPISSIITITNLTA